MPMYKECDECGGWGKCPHCKNDPGTKPDGKECPCGYGGGLTIGQCVQCHGSGFVEEDEKILGVQDPGKKIDWDDEMKKL